MIIGIPKEIKNNENRVGANPAAVREFVKHGHTVYVQATAGVGSGYADEEVVFTNTDGEEFIFETDISGVLSCVLPEGEYSVASRGFEGTLMIDKDTVISIGG